MSLGTSSLEAGAADIYSYLLVTPGSESARRHQTVFVQLVSVFTPTGTDHNY